MPSRKTKAKTRPRWRRLLPYALMLFCAACAVLAVYMVYLDGKVRARFEGARWTLPAKVYASPLQLYAGRKMGPTQLIHALERQGYRKESDLAGPGSYRRTGSGVDVYSRPFTFWDGHQPAEEVRLRFSGHKIAAMRGLGDTQDVPLLRLDPLLIGSIYPTHGADRILVKLDDVPPLLPAGLIVVEDRDFLHHYGVSPKAILRAAWANLRAGHVVQGGSTLTQQLVKNLFLSNKQTLGRKAKEALMAILLDAHYSKSAILQTYLNEVYLGQDGSRSIHGFGLASYFYFQKPLKELEPQEIALLVGMVKGPSYYNPRRYPDRARKRRNLVLRMFRAANFISEKAARKAEKAPLGVVHKAPKGTTQYPAFIDLVRRQLQGQYRDKDLTEEGLRIFTTLNPQAQAVAEQQVSKGVAQLEKSRHMKTGTLQGAAVVTSVQNGRVLALVGGRDARYAGFNRALDAYRPIGSLMKPVVYLTALDQPSRYSVVTPLDDGPLSVKMPSGKVWQPQNYSRKSHGHNVPMYQALEHSYNLASSRLALAVGIPDVIKTLKKLGYPGDPEAVPSLALGAVDMAPLQVAQIYNTLAAGGFYTPLLAIRAVTTKDGKPLSRYPLQLHRAVDEQSVYLLNWILQRVTHDGTGRSAYYTLPGRINVAGKTGTTDGLRDSWFAGFAGNRVSVVWVGRDDNKPSKFTGATGALQIWSRIMRDMHPQSFDPLMPDGIKTIPLVLRDAGEDEAGQNATVQDCSAATPVPFMSGDVPDDVQPCQPPDEKPEKKGGWFHGLF